MAEKEYIERDKVMDALLHEQYGYLCEDAINSIPAADVVERASGIIGVIPTADVRPVVRAVWRRYSPFTDTKENGYKFCPHCGATMVMEDEQYDFGFEEDDDDA